MIKNIKLRVTPEQSRKVQEICFSKGIVWGSIGDLVSYTDAPYLYITNGRSLTYGNSYDFFLTTRKKEMDANLFIQSNGTGTRKLLKQKGNKMIDYNFKVKSPSQEVALAMAQILIKKYGFPTRYITNVKDPPLNKPYLYIYLTTWQKHSINWMPEGSEDYFIDHENKEIDINVFIRTNGTMKPTKLLKQKAIK